MLITNVLHEQLSSTQSRGGAPSYTIINVQQAMSDKIKTDLIISANKILLTALYL